MAVFSIPVPSIKQIENNELHILTVLVGDEVVENAVGAVVLPIFNIREADSKFCMDFYKHSVSNLCLIQLATNQIGLGVFF